MEFGEAFKHLEKLYPNITNDFFKLANKFEFYRGSVDYDKKAKYPNDIPDVIVVHTSFKNYPVSQANGKVMYTMKYLGGIVTFDREPYFETTFITPAYYYQFSLRTQLNSVIDGFNAIYDVLDDSRFACMKVKHNGVLLDVFFNFGHNVYAINTKTNMPEILQKANVFKNKATKLDLNLCKKYRSEVKVTIQGDLMTIRDFMFTLYALRMYDIMMKLDKTLQAESS
jgi:hypothetical protein